MKKEYINYLDNYLSEFAMREEKSLGRKISEQPCSIRSDYQRDRDRIVHSKAFRRLKHKTQVFIAPDGDHFVTRMTHTLEVTLVARTISRALRLNEDLTEAIALGHDLGHTPFGHSGERILRGILGHFEHNEQGLRVVDELENDGKGLNLTHEVRDGILHHKKDGNPMTLEGKVVSLADRIAYINHDIDDAIMAEILKERDLPASTRKLLGNSKRERINNLISDIIKTSYAKPYVAQSEDFAFEMSNLRQFMFDNIYFNPTTNYQTKKAERLIKCLFDYFVENNENVPYYNSSIDKKIQVADYIAGMTDNYAIRVFKDIFMVDTYENSIGEIDE